MKKIFLLYMLLIVSWCAGAQALLEDKDGDVLFRNTINTTSDLALIKLNTGNQSIGFKYILSSFLNNPSNYKIHEFGIQARPTEGYAVVLRNGQFSPGIRMSYALTKVSLFCNTPNYTDWGNISIGYDVNKYALFREDVPFDKQFYSKDFRALSIVLNYNALINSLWIVSLKAGYVRSNNYDDLNTVEAKDMKLITDITTSTERQISKTRTAKQGDFVAFDAYPLSISITKSTPTDPSGSPAAGKLKVGYSAYLKSLVSNELPNTNAGLLFFLTKQAANGVRNPVFGINIQASDLFDVANKNEGLANRLAVAFTTVFSL